MVLLGGWYYMHGIITTTSRFFTRARTPICLKRCLSVVCMVLLFSAQAWADLSSNLEGYWQMDGDGSDQTTNSLDLTINGGAAFVSGLIGQALAFTGVDTKFADRGGDDDEILDPGSDDFSLQVWVNFNSAGGEQTIMEKFTGGAGPGYTLSKLGTGQIQLYATSFSLTTVAQSLSAGTWYQLVFTRTGSTNVLYLNGSSIGQNTSTSSVPNTSADFMIGERDGVQNFPVNGNVDEAAFWSRGLSSAEVTTLYNGGSGTSIVFTSVLQIVCPPDVTNSCSDSISTNVTGSATTTGTCATAATISFVDSTVSADCSNVISRIWSATNACGDFATCTQLISQVDMAAPVLVCPSNLAIECNASTNTSNTGVATATDNCDTNVALSFNDTVMIGVCTGTISRVWTATDDCGNSSVCTQIITLIEVSNPGSSYYVDVNNPSPVYPYTTWGTAATKIQDAVNEASKIVGSTVWVSNGVYEVGGMATPGYTLTNRVVITNGISVRSVNGPEVTIIKGAESGGGGTGVDAIRGAYLSDGLLSGFTITNGYSGGIFENYNYERCGGGINMYGGSGTVANCIIAGNVAGELGGGSYYGTLANCMIVGNVAGSGGGSYDGTVSNSSFVGNFAQSGGGAYQGTLVNCALYGNRAISGGGGSANSFLYSCTVTGNSAVDGVGGVLGNFVSTMANCIIYHNKSYADANDNYSDGVITHTCTTPDPGGTGNITNDPILVSVSHIHENSPCVAMGSSNDVVGVDIDGNAWASTPSMGCDEPTAPFVGALIVSMLADYTNIAVGYELSIMGDILGEVRSNRWDFGDGEMKTNQVYVQHAWVSSGTYDVVLTAYNDAFPGGVVATMQVVVASQSDFYVAVNNPSPVTPFVTWGSAATKIQDAVDEASKIGGSTVWVSNGVYEVGSTVTPDNSSNNRVVITRDIVVRSVNGPAVTFIKGAAATGGGIGVDAVRGVYMSAGKLSGFTITNGHAGATSVDPHGGGVFVKDRQGSVSNCVLTGNVGFSGGGAFGGRFSHCQFIGNVATSVGRGGGARDAILSNCTIVGNSAYSGGGVGHCTLTDCTLSSNMAVVYRGGGSHEGAATRCTYTGNSADLGGGASFGTLNNCVLIGNSATDSGGGGLFSANE